MCGVCVCVCFGLVRLQGVRVYGFWGSGFWAVSGFRV